LRRISLAMARLCLAICGGILALTKISFNQMDGMVSVPDITPETRIPGLLSSICAIDLLGHMRPHKTMTVIQKYLIVKLVKLFLKIHIPSTSLKIFKTS